ncbi:hypothetical protein OB920_07615 [Halobacteria archaeon HArc-gm2]|nr:hypothetical protein [Halobacteria archaeon HArc-gm2]
MKQYRFVQFLGSEIEEVGKEVDGIAQRIVDEYEQGELPSEREANQEIARQIRKVLTKRIQQRLDGKVKNGVEFYARVLSSQKKGSEESMVGADIAIVFEADLPDYKVSKSVLVQSKTWRSRSSKDRFNIQHLEDEVEDMLKWSSDSFIFVFPVEGSVKVIPAFAIKALTDAGESIPSDYPDKLYTKSIGRFFEELAECYIGDHKIIQWAKEPLSWEENNFQLMIDELQIDTLLYIGVQKEFDETAQHDFE